MKGVIFLTNELNQKVAVQIDLKTINKHQEEVEDLLDGIIAEARKDEEKIPLPTVLKNLKKAGKLQ
jgi:cytochrome P450